LIADIWYDRGTNANTNAREQQKRMCHRRQSTADPNGGNGDERDKHGCPKSINPSSTAILSNPMTKHHIEHEEGTIGKGEYEALDLNPVALGLPIAAYIRIRPNSGQLPRIAELAQQIPEVVECHRVTGEDCFILKVHIPAIDQLDRLLDSFLLYGSTTTNIIQSSPVPLRPPPLPEDALQE
jgi:Lrp/AsnC family leucine-responsive transcriptional regulator